MITRLGAAAGQNSGGGGTSFTLSGLNTTGANLIVVFAEWDSSVGSGAITDSKGNGYVQFRQEVAPAYARVTGWWCLNPIVGTGHDIYFNGGNYITGAVAFYSGVHASASIDAHTGAGATIAAVVSVPSLTPAEANELLVTFFGGSCTDASNPPGTVSDGYTIRASIGNVNAHACALADQIQTTATARAPVWTMPANFFGGAAIQVAFKSAVVSTPLEGSAAIAITAAGTLSMLPVLTGAATIAVTASATLSTVAAALSGAAAITLTAAGTIIAPVGLRGAASIVFSATAGFEVAFTGAAAIVFRASATLSRSPRYSTVKIELDGEDITPRVRKAGVQIRDIINDAANTATLIVQQPDPPRGGLPIRITMNDGALVLFAGVVQTAGRTYDLRPVTQNQQWPTNAIDDTARANRLRPFGTFANQSASAIAAALAAEFAPDFDTAIAPDLPVITRINFDGTDTMIAALVRLANIIGGYAKVEDNRITLFLEDLTEPPDPVDVAHPPLNDPPVRVNVDHSQLRTRVYGKGYGESIPTNVLAGETLLPLSNGATFTETGGLAITGTTADGAQHQRIAYTARVLSPGGTLVGPGVTPSAPPTADLAAGSGVTSGVHTLTVVWVTASGKTRASAPVTITVGVMDGAVAPVAGAAQAGNGPDDGLHQYALSFVTASGETTPGARVDVLTSSTPIAPSSVAPTAQSHSFEVNEIWSAGDALFYCVTYRTASGGETTPSANSNTMAVTVAPNGKRYNAYVTGLLTPPAGVTARRIYRNRNGVWEGFAQTPNLTDPYYIDNALPMTPGVPPSSNTASNPTRQVPLSGLQLGGAMVTARKLWGTVAGGSQLKLIATLNTTDTTYLVTTPDSGLGANAPTTGTAVGNRIALSNVQIGPSGVLSREIYMSLAGTTTPRRRALTIANNTATTGTVTIDDAALASETPEPTGDTSALTQPTGQINPGADHMLLADVTPFRPAGGWLYVGAQAIRYTGIVGQEVQGIPPSGPGAITVPMLYGQQAIAASMLIGVTGLDLAIERGSLVHIWVQRDDLVAQAEHGVVEYLITDTRRAEPSLTERCDAELALFAQPIVTVTYATRDPKTKSGKTVLVNLPTPAVSELLTIQDVTITEIDIAPNTLPRFSVTATSVRFTLEDTLRRLIAATPQIDRV